MLGRRDAYLRKWVRGEAKDLLVAEERYLLARYFSVDARVLGAPSKAPVA